MTYHMQFHAFRLSKHEPNEAKRPTSSSLESLEYDVLLLPIDSEGLKEWLPGAPRRSCIWITGRVLAHTLCVLLSQKRLSVAIDHK